MQQIIKSDEANTSRLTLGGRQVAFSGVARPVNHVKAGHTMAKAQVQPDSATYDVHPISQGAVDGVLIASAITVAGMFALLGSTMRQHDLNHSSSGNAVKDGEKLADHAVENKHQQFFRRIGQDRHKHKPEDYEKR